MTVDRIGEAAGAVWRKLSEKGSQGLVDLKKLPGFTADEVAAGIGWLAREGKLSFESNNAAKKIVVKLAEEPAFS